MVEINIHASKELMPTKLLKFLFILVVIQVKTINLSKF